MSRESGGYVLVYFIDQASTKNVPYITYITHEVDIEAQRETAK